jgi:hypothetical protein
MGNFKSTGVDIQNIDPTKAKGWTKEEVAKWLSDNGFGQYRSNSTIFGS